jgi:transposase InsO family protein
MMVHQEQFPVKRMSKVFNVSRSGFLAWRQRGPSAREREDVRLGVRVREVFKQSDSTYGSPRIYAHLKAEGESCGKHKVERLMRENKLQGVQTPRFRVTTTDSNHGCPVPKNILGRDFYAPQMNTKWAGDITCIRTGQGWLYLAVIIDLCSRRIVGWATAKEIDADLVCRALNLALEKRRPRAQLLFHSDRGAQYASVSYQRILREQGISCSMSRKGDCWDNAVSESFFHTLKVERVHRKAYRTREQAEMDLFDYIERFYNRWRRHSTIGYQCPNEYEQQLLAA